MFFNAFASELIFTPYWIYILFKTPGHELSLQWGIASVDN